MELTRHEALDGFHLTNQEFELFRDFFHRQTGIFYSPVKKDTVAMRLARRMAAIRLPEFRAYFAHLHGQVSGGEMQLLINAMTINETYFYREEEHFRCLVGPLLEETMRFKRPGEAVRFWSIPCSTGEEPYSLALYLLENWPLVNRTPVALLAADIDTEVLARAREGVYSPRAVHRLPPPMLKRYFSPTPEGEYRLCDEVREVVDFSQVNLSDAVATKRFRGMDVIFCRNLLIYFSETSRRQAAEALYDALNPGGFLLLGQSESISRITSLFQVRRFPGVLVYQKPRVS